MIKRLRHSEIDRQRWDQIAMTATGQPYALSWWLDIVSPQWEALVEDDYQAIMPLTIKKKYGIKYIVQPKWTQQLGVFGSSDADKFLRKIPFLSYDLNLNHKNQSKQTAKVHTNYVIDQESKSDENTRRNVRKASALEYKDVETEQFKTLWYSENRHMGEDAYRMLGEIVEACKKREMALLYGAYSEDRLVAAMFAVKTEQRVILLAPVSNEEGKQRSAMFGIMDRVINSNRDRLTDCEGSMLPGVARFYRGFGGKEQNYQRVWRLSPRKKH